MEALDIFCGNLLINIVKIINLLRKDINVII